MYYLDLTVAKESRRIKSSLYAISGKMFGKESVLTVLVSKKYVALPVGSINVDQRVVENSVVRDNQNFDVQNTSKP